MSNSSPQEWVSYTIDEVVNRYIDFRGRTPIKLGMEWGGGDIRALSANNVQMGKIDFDKECYFGSESLYQRWMTKGNCSKGDIAFTTEAPLGNVAQIPDDKKYILSQRTILLKVCPDVASTDYIYHLLRSEPFQTELIRHSTGSTVVGIQQKKLAKIKVTIPSVFVQHKIAKILSTVDNLIEKTQALIHKYQSIKQGMMHDLFARGVDENGQLRSSYEEAPYLYKESELGWIPKEWEIKGIGELSIGGVKNGYFKRPELVGSGYKLINVSELYQDFGVDTRLESVERVEADDKDFEKYKAIEGDLFFTRSSLVLSGIAWCNIIRTVHEPTLYECHVMRIRPNKDKMVPDFLALFCKSRAARDYLMARAKQVTMTTIAQPDIIGLPVPVPVIDEQKEIASRILHVDTQLRTESSYLIKLQGLKKGLMQDLLTGRVKAPT